MSPQYDPDVLFYEEQRFSRLTVGFWIRGGPDSEKQFQGFLGVAIPLLAAESNTRLEVIRG